MHIPLAIEDANILRKRAVYPVRMLEREVNSRSSTKGENHDSPLWKPHRVKSLEVANVRNFKCNGYKTIFMKTLRPFYFFVVVWGRSFCDYLTNYCIPSLLAPNNLPKLHNRNANKFIVCTTSTDWEVLEKHPILKTLSHFLEIIWIEIPFPPPDVSSCQHMGIGHKLATEMCFKDKAYGIALTPDLLLSNGSLEIVQQHAVDGKHAVLCGTIRLSEEAFFTGLAQNDTQPTHSPKTELAISSRQLVKLSLQSLHSETEGYDFESRNYAYLRPTSMWRMPDQQGMILHTLSWCPLLIDYQAMPTHDTSALETWTMDGDYLHKNLSDPSKIYLSQDSDELMVVSWSPSDYHQLKLKKPRQNRLLQQWQLYKNRLHLDETLQSPVFDPLKLSLFYKPIFWHAGDIDASWHKKSREINKLLDKPIHLVSKYLFHSGRLFFHYTKKIIEYGFTTLLTCFGNQSAKQKLSGRIQLFIKSRKSRA